MNPEKEQEIIEKNILNEQRSRSNTHRLDEHEKRIEKIEGSDIGVRLTKVEYIATETKEEFKQVKEDISAFYKMAVSQDALTTTLKTITADHKEQMKDFGKTLDNVNNNLTALNNKSDNLQDDLNRFENDLQTVKESHRALEETGKFNLKEFLFQEAPKYVGLALIAFLLAYFGIK